jgi:hypothetical protein
MDAGVKFLVFGLPTVAGIVIFWMGCSVFLETAYNCEDYITDSETGETVPNSWPYEENHAKYEECKDDKSYSYLYMLTGGLIVLVSIIAAAISFASGATKMIINKHNQNRSLGDSPRPPKE